MSLAPDQAEALARTGIDALRRGDGATARAAFDRLIAEAPDSPRPWLPLAQACRLAGDAAAETRALESLLAAEPRHLAALLLMGNRKRDDGDDRGAVSFYTTALNQAGTATAPIAAPLQALLQQAQAFRAAAAARFETHLLAAVAADAESSRVRESLDLLLGRREVYLQLPSMFYFPGLAQRAFFDRADFAWVEDLEAATPAIRAELEAVLAEETGFEPYVAGSAGRPRPNNPLFDDPSWSAFHLWKGGALVADNARRCPATIAALERLPIPRIVGRSPMALFSRLRPGTHIQPHHGMLNTRLICHLPLIVPRDCGLRVGSETRAWREGCLTIFDDSFEHEAWNRSDTTRTVLLFEIWRPDIADTERAQLGRIFEAIDAYAGPPVEGD